MNLKTSARLLDTSTGKRLRVSVSASKCQCVIPFLVRVIYDTSFSRVIGALSNLPLEEMGEKKRGGRAKGNGEKKGEEELLEAG